MDAADLVIEHARRTNTFRLDLMALRQFVKAREAGKAPDEDALVTLFWEMLRPRLDDGEFRDNPPPLDADIECILLEGLARLERQCRVPPEPGSDRLEGERYEHAIQYVHVGAASALRHRKRDGLNEDVVKTLQEVSRILYLLEETRAVTNIVDAPIGIVSLFGVKALVDKELAHVKRLDGRYQEAFDIAFDGFVFAEAVWDAVDWDDMDLYRQFLIEIFGEERLALEERTRAAVRRCLPLYQPQQIADCFELLRAQDKSDNWRRVARQCERLALTLDDDLQEQTILDGNHREVDWYRYWSLSEGWATARLSPQELHEFLHKEKETASKDRKSVV